MTEPADDKEKDWRDSLPFPAHWLSYLTFKLLVLALASAIAMHLLGFF